LIALIQKASQKLNLFPRGKFVAAWISRAKYLNFQAE